jgi:hypothetical protein
MVSYVYGALTFGRVFCSTSQCVNPDGFTADGPNMSVNLKLALTTSCR